MRFNWKTPLTALGGMGASVAMLALARTPAAAELGVMLLAGAVTSQFAAAGGFIGDRFDQWGKRRDASIGARATASESVEVRRSDLADPAADTALRSGEDDPTRRIQELRHDGLDIIADMNKAALNDRFQDVDALLDRLGQVRAEHRRLEATPETADASRENTARGPGPPETERQDAPPESERAGGPDGRPPGEAEQATDTREGSTPSAAEVSNADARGAAVAQAVPDDPSSESTGRGEAGLENEGDESQRHDVDPTQPAGTQQEPRVGEGAEQTPTGDHVRRTEVPPGGPTQPPETEREPTVGEGAEQTPTGSPERASEAPLGGPTQTPGTEPEPTVGAGGQQTPTGDHERDSEVPASDPSGERPPQEAGGTPQPRSPQPASDPSREPQLPARHPGSGVSAEQLQAMKGPWPRFERPESITDAASRKQAALAAMTSDRPARQQPGDSTDEADQAHHPEPSTGAAPPQPARDREMD